MEGFEFSMKFALALCRFKGGLIPPSSGFSVLPNIFLKEVDREEST